MPENLNRSSRSPTLLRFSAIVPEKLNSPAGKPILLRFTGLLRATLPSPCSIQAAHPTRAERQRPRA